MGDTFRQFYVYFKGRKVGYATNKSYNIDFARTPLEDDNDRVHHAQGVMKTQLSTDKIVPVQGTQDGMLDEAMKQGYVDIALATVDGKIHQVEMAILTAKYDTSTDGTLTGQFEFGGGKPKLTG